MISITTLQLKQVTTVPAELIYVPGSLADTLQAAEQAKLQAQFAPEVARYRSNDPHNEALWNNWINTPSLRATGKTNLGSKVVVYAHVPHHYSNPDNVRAAVETGQLRNGAGVLPQAEFQRLVDLDGLTDEQGMQRVWVVAYEKFKRAPNGTIKLADALAHPQTIPFLGSEQGAQDYLAAHKVAYSTNTIGNYSAVDAFDEGSATAPSMATTASMALALSSGYRWRRSRAKP